MLTAADGLLLAGMAFVGAAAQLCLKRGADLGRAGHFALSFFRPWVIAGVLLLAANMLIMVWMLRRLPLTAVLPVTAFVYILVPIGAFVFFGERPQPLFWFGACLIVAGIAVAAASMPL